MFCILYLNSSVSKAYWVVVKSDNTRVRNAASTDSEVMTAVNAGDRLSVYSEEQGADGKHGVRSVLTMYRAMCVRIPWRKRRRKRAN